MADTSQRDVPKQPQKLDRTEFYVAMLTNLLSKFGLRGTIVIVVMYVFLSSGSQAQHQEFINRYILFKFDKPTDGYVFFLILVLIGALGGTYIFLSKKLKEKDAQLKVLEKANYDLVQKSKRKK